jgi:membrane peptidoglycan carboxypeptidase
MVLEYDVRDRCQFADVPPEIAKDHFTQPFVHKVYLPDGTIGEQTTGPGSENWTALEDISPYMQIAVLTTEDGAFLHHHGFNRAAIRASLIANIKAGRFVRGASTITMQLAKNLFLSRDKTLARKLEEVVLAEYLEQTFSKEELMELYLNVIEFGPAVYGIGAAADYYFGRRPAELNLAECLFLASVLPSPIRYGSLRDGGELPDARMHGIRTLMEIAHRNGRIDETQLAEAEGETIEFWRGGDRPAPRPPVQLRSHFDGESDDVPALPLDEEAP